MTDQEIDVEALRTELDHIKDAMGLRDQYRSAPEQWLLFGTLVPVAAALSQYVHLQEMAPWYHTPIWLTVLGVGGTFGNWLLLGEARARRSPTELLYGGPKPNVFLPLVVVYFASVPIQIIFTPFFDDIGYHTGSIYILGLILVLLGVAYVLVGNVMKAHYIRFRDRLAIYAGGLWMVPLGVAMPYSDVLLEWGYAAFGASYFVYAAVTYAILRGETDE